jgi:hypothetical protein
MKKLISMKNTETKGRKMAGEMAHAGKNGMSAGKTLGWGMMFILLLFIPLSAASAQTSDNGFSFFALLLKNQDASVLHLFSEKNPVAYSMFYGQKSSEVYFVRTEDIFSSERLVCKFGPGFKVGGASAFSLLLNTTTGLDMLSEESLEAIGTLAWANLSRTGNTEIPYLIHGEFIAKDAKSRQIFQTLVLGKLQEVR